LIYILQYDTKYKEEYNKDINYVCNLYNGLIDNEKKLELLELFQNEKSKTNESEEFKNLMNKYYGDKWYLTQDESFDKIKTNLIKMRFGEGATEDKNNVKEFLNLLTELKSELMSKNEKYRYLALNRI
jgi:hypothetical protein